MADQFPPDSVIRRINIEPAPLFGAARALLLQLAHPAVAQGVDDHSDFKGQPFKRLQGTLEAVYSVVHGSEELARAVGARIQRIHGYVTGPGYRANEPSNLLWVHATLVDTALDCYRRLAGPVPPDDAEAYYRDMTTVAELFGVPRDSQPATLAAFQAYFDATVEELEVTDTARDLAGFILDPRLPLRLDVPMAPLTSLQRLFALGTLPPVLRERYGFPWTGADQRRFERAERRVARVYRATPFAVRTAPMRHVYGPLLLRQAARHTILKDQRPDAAAAS